MQCYLSLSCWEFGNVRIPKEDSHPAGKYIWKFSSIALVNMNNGIFSIAMEMDYLGVFMCYIFVSR
jgi:hypothetical protein